MIGRDTTCDYFSGRPGHETSFDGENLDSAEIYIKSWRGQDLDLGQDHSRDLACPFLGGEVSPEDDRDWYLEDMSMATGLPDDLPKEYIIELPLGPFDQGENYSCGACVGALLMEIHEALGFLGEEEANMVTRPAKERVAAGKNIDSRGANKEAVPAESSQKSKGPTTARRLSSGFIYHHRVNTPSRGMFGRDVFRILKKIGVSTEAKYPSSRLVEATPKPGGSAYRSAESRKIPGFAKVGTVATLQRAIVEIGPAYMLLPCWDKSWDFWREKKAFPADGKNIYPGSPHGVARHSQPRPSKETGRAKFMASPECHAVAVIGYNPRGFIIASSWGSAWGRRGRVLFPYGDWPVVREVWVPLRQVSSGKKQNFARVIRAPFSRVSGQGPNTGVGLGLGCC